MGFLAGLSSTVALWLGILLGGTIGFGSGAIAWKYQGTKITELQLSNLRYEAAARVAQQVAQAEAEKANLKIEQLVVDLDAAQERRKNEHVEMAQKIDEVASAERVCFSDAVVGVLNGERPRDRQARKDPGPQVALGLAPRPAPDPPRPGLSERGASQYLNQVRDAYVALRNQTKALIGVVEACPAVEIMEGE